MLQILLSDINSLICTQLNCFKRRFVRLTIQLNISHLFTQFKCQTIDGTLSGAITPCLSGPGCKGNERVLHITERLPLDSLMSYPGHSLGRGILTPL